MKKSIEIQGFKMVGSIFLFPHFSVCYDSRICERAVNFGWLLWGFSLVRKNEMHL